MAVSLEYVMSTLSPEERAEVEARAQELIEEELTLRDLRAVQHLTQQRVAELLGIEQDSVSRMERRADMLLSTMSSYVEAMGGRLRLVAEFPNRRPYTVKLGDLTERQEKPSRRRKPATASAPAVAARKKTKLA
ncbi:Helix-turn-helix domain-containing protein [Granulicella rosea]|uniref:Helix-turn-helix domain-containing protein n=1 Tax=Granulicella rosea TaxID=474952 RepID=A0A239MEV0_9BACT|nr:XRE family transcriptional regulator [Granulicella rosea]SNT41215.1 Helix-turn-helix domain-containing protein [Granulicella rosea]